MNQQNFNKLINEALAIEAEEAKEAGALGYMARALIQATIPHSRVNGNEFKRSNGLYTLYMLSPSDIGLPYGSIPRLLMSWLTTEAVKTKAQTLVLGKTLSEFMSILGLVPTGGRWGTITYLKEQARRLFSTHIACTYDGGNRAAGQNFIIADNYNLWWEPKAPMQAALWESTVTLNKRFFDEIISSPVPIDMRAFKALKRSPMALDIYCWLTYRMSYLKRQTSIPWGLLQMQFGADYADDKSGRYAFKKKFNIQMLNVLTLYPEATVEQYDNGIILKPSKSHIGRIYNQVKG